MSWQKGIILSNKKDILIILIKYEKERFIKKNIKFINFIKIK